MQEKERNRVQNVTATDELLEKKCRGHNEVDWEIVNTPLTYWSSFQGSDSGGEEAVLESGDVGGML